MALDLTIFLTINVHTKELTISVFFLMVVIIRFL